jgi:hypothetical protein
MAERVIKSQKMAEPHAQARAALGVRHGTETCGDTAGVEHEWDRGRAQEAGRGLRGRARLRVGVAGSVDRLAGWFNLWVHVMDQWIHHAR